MISTELIVTWIGKAALGLLAGDPTAQIMGVTSRGVFLHLAAEKMVFISGEQYRGPLTLNVNVEPGSLGFCCSGDAVVVQAGRISFDPGSFSLDYRTAVAWEAPEVAAATFPVEQRIAFLGKVADRVLSARAETGLSFLLVSLLQGPDSAQAEIDPHTPLAALLGLRQALETGKVEAALAAAEPFLGLGSGLTPSGDDLLLGFLLALNRWGRRLDVRFDIQIFNQKVLEFAGRRTTTLSSNLLTCAADGQADERLVIALDALFTGQLSPAECAANLLKWGSSSGCDAFVGMALMVQVLSSSILGCRYAH